MLPAASLKAFTAFPVTSIPQSLTFLSPFSLFFLPFPSMIRESLLLLARLTQLQQSLSDSSAICVPILHAKAYRVSYSRFLRGDDFRGVFVSRCFCADCPTVRACDSNLVRSNPSSVLYRVRYGTEVKTDTRFLLLSFPSSVLSSDILLAANVLFKY